MAPAALLSGATQSRCLSGAACSTTGRGGVAGLTSFHRARRATAAAARSPSPTPTPTLAARCRRRRLSPARATFFDQAWGTRIDGQSLAAQLFALSLLPYLGFLYYLRKPETKAPPLVLGGFWFLLVFVFATIPAGIYAKKVYGTSLANVDWLHGGAESLLTVTNLLLVVGLRRGIRGAEEAKRLEATAAAAAGAGAGAAGEAGEADAAPTAAAAAAAAAAETAAKERANR